MTESNPSVTVLAIRFLQERFLSLVFVGIAVGLLVTQIGVSVPTWMELAGVSALGAAPIGYFAFGRIKAHLPEPPMVWVVDVDLLDDQGGGIYRLPTREFQEVQVLDGSLWNPAPSLYFGRRFDLDASTIEGTWRGTASDAELLRALSMVQEIRGQLEAQAKRGSRIENQAFTIIRNATRQNTRHVVETFEKGTLPKDGQALGDAIETAIEDFGLEQMVEEHGIDGDDLDQEDDELAESVDVTEPDSEVSADD